VLCSSSSSAVSALADPGMDSIGLVLRRLFVQSYGRLSMTSLPALRFAAFSSADKFLSPESPRIGRERVVPFAANILAERFSPLPHFDLEAAAWSASMSVLFGDTMGCRVSVAGGSVLPLPPGLVSCSPGRAIVGEFQIFDIHDCMRPSGRVAAAWRLTGRGVGQMG